MPIKLGSANVTLKLGSQSVTGRLGATLVTATVPGAPTITSASAGSSVAWTTPSTGDSPLTGYRLYVDNILTEDAGWTTTSGNTFTEGEVIQVSAVNAVGEGPKSAPVTVT